MPAEPIMFPAIFAPRQAGKRPAQTLQQAIQELRQRTAACLNKLSDRDTFQLASAELDSLVRSLTPDLFSPFLSCLSETDPDHKGPVRRECVRLLAAMAESHGDALAGFVPKMIAAVVRQLKDADSGVRAVCANAVQGLAEQVTQVPVAVILKPLSDSLGEQGYAVQAGSAMCLVSAIEGSPDPDLSYLQRMVPRVVKLLASQSFKARAALLAVAGAIINAGAAKSQPVLSALAPAMVECLKSSDWATRKAAAEAISQLATMEGDAAAGFRSRCVDSLESCRFDKVKHVRDSVNQALDAYKNAFNEYEENSPSKESKSGQQRSNDVRSTSKAASNSPFLRRKEFPRSQSPPNAVSAAGTKKKGTINGHKSSHGLGKTDGRMSDWKIEIAVPRSQGFKVACEEDGVEEDEPVRGMRDMGNVHSKPLGGIGEDRSHRAGGSRGTSRIVPFHENESSISTVVVSNAVESDNSENDLTLIRRQLLQIENQQTSLLDLLQMLIGSSQNGMRSLESRVRGLEMALDEISHDLAVSTGRVHGIDNGGNICCILPGTEFLSSKFWRKAEGRYTSARFSVSGTSSAGLYNSGAKESVQSFRWENRRFRGSVNPLAAAHSRGVDALHHDMPKQTISFADSMNECSSNTSMS